MNIEKELTASGVKLNIVLIPFMVIAYFVLSGAYNYFWGDIEESHMAAGLFIPLLVVSIVVHELIHGLTWMVVGKLQWKDIKYGFIWQAMMPYAHSKKPLNKRGYQWGAAMPGLILGVLPYLLGLCFGLSDVANLGMIMTICAGGDAWILWIIRKEPIDAFIIDHPSKAGCFVVAPATNSLSIRESSIV